MLSLVGLAGLLLGLYIGFKAGVWYANSPARKAASAVKSGAQGSWNGAKSLLQKAKDAISGDNKPKGPKEKP